MKNFVNINSLYFTFPLTTNLQNLIKINRLLKMISKDMYDDDL